MIGFTDTTYYFQQKSETRRRAGGAQHWTEPGSRGARKTAGRGTARSAKMPCSLGGLRYSFTSTPTPTAI
jgi:hypothetical protein